YSGFKLGDGGTVGLNVSQAVTASNITFTGGCTGGGCPDGGTQFTQNTGNEDGVGAFNFVLDNTDGATNAVNSITFTIPGSSAFGNAAGVLSTDPTYTAAAHIFVGTVATGYAANGSTNVVPEPGTLVLLGSALMVGVGAWTRRRVRGRSAIISA